MTWLSDTDTTADGTTWFTGTPALNDGTTWAKPIYGTRQLMLSASLAAITLVVMLATLMPLASAAPKAKDPYAHLDVGEIVCDDFTTTTLEDIVHGIGADQAHAQGLTGAGVDIAVIDTGVNELLGLNGRVVEGPDFSFDSENPNIVHRDFFGHGTAMASIIAADNTAYGDGLAPGSRIVNVKVGAANGAVDVSQVIAAIDWVVEHRNANGMDIRVLNLSYGTDSDSDPAFDPLSYAVENAWKHGIVVVVSAGNETRDVVGLANPALNPFVIAVGGAGKSVIHDSGWKAADWTSRGDWVRHPDIIAPGECVLSAGVPGSALFETSSSAQHYAGGEAFLRGSGTSQAAAVVSGSAALLLEQRPWLTPDQIKALMTSNARMPHSDLHRNNMMRKAQAPRIAGSGLLDVAAMLGAPDPVGAQQSFAPATGLGLLHDARGTQLVGDLGDQLVGEETAFGTEWNPHAWLAGEAWTDSTWSGGTWSGGTWSGGTWSGGTWSGGTWSGGTWSGGTWSGGTWSGGTWSGGTWSGGTWSGGTWSGGTWSNFGWQ